jgi:hypothetical protein
MIQRAVQAIDRLTERSEIHFPLGQNAGTFACTASGTKFDSYRPTPPDSHSLLIISKQLDTVPNRTPRCFVR